MQRFAEKKENREKRKQGKRKESTAGLFITSSSNFEMNQVSSLRTFASSRLCVKNRSRFVSANSRCVIMVVMPSAMIAIQSIIVPSEKRNQLLSGRGVGVSASVIRFGPKGCLGVATFDYIDIWSAQRREKEQSFPSPLRLTCSRFWQSTYFGCKLPVSKPAFCI